MDEYSAVLLVEVFYGLGFGIKFDGSGDRRREFLVGEIDAC